MPQITLKACRSCTCMNMNNHAEHGKILHYFDKKFACLPITITLTTSPSRRTALQDVQRPPKKVHNNSYILMRDPGAG